MIWGAQVDIAGYHDKMKCAPINDCFLKSKRFMGFQAIKGKRKIINKEEKT